MSIDRGHCAHFVVVVACACSTFQSPTISHSIRMVHRLTHDRFLTSLPEPSTRRAMPAAHTRTHARTKCLMLISLQFGYRWKTASPPTSRTAASSSTRPRNGPRSCRPRRSSGTCSARMCAKRRPSFSWEIKSICSGHASSRRWKGSSWPTKSTSSSSKRPAAYSTMWTSCWSAY